jgi:dTDP-4-dehydrorhamnose reductase
LDLGENEVILVFGTNGQVATALRQKLSHGVVFIGSEAADFSNPTAVISALNLHQPKIVINAAAYTAVDKAEADRDTALQINATTPGLIAEWCEKHECKLIHFSTDYVFNGAVGRAWVETDKPSPLNWYGETKWRGETAILEKCKQSYIFRVSWVISPWGHNFIKTIGRLAREKNELRIVSDQLGSPTDARNIASFIERCIDQKFYKLSIAPGVAHLAFLEPMSWHQLALTAVSELRAKGVGVVVNSILPIVSAEYTTPAQRPLNSKLASDREDINRVMNEIKTEGKIFSLVESLRSMEY